VDISGSPYCGGSLVAPDVVLTAGHCLSSDDNFSVVVNGYNLYSSDGPLQYETDVQYAVRHPGFDPETYDNDALLLKLSSPVSDVPFVLINFDEANPQPGDDLTVMGLGNKEEDGAPASTLQAVSVQAVDHDTCQGNYRDAGFDRLDDDIMLCAGNLVEGGRDVRTINTYILSSFIVPP
jgi:secreted trypsin-like serine protease